MDELTKQLTRIADALERIAQQNSSTVEHKMTVFVDDRKARFLKGAVTAVVDNDLRNQGGTACVRVLTGG